MVGDHDYTVIPVTYALTATKTGPLTLGPFTATAVVVVPPQNQQGGDPSSDNFSTRENRNKFPLATETEKLQGLPLPDRNKPASFSGAIGNFTMTVSVGPTNITVGDPVTVRVEISGHGSLDSITLPDQSTLNDFKIFPPTVKTQTSDTARPGRHQNI